MPSLPLAGASAKASAKAPQQHYPESGEDEGPVLVQHDVSEEEEEEEEEEGHEDLDDADEKEPVQKPTKKRKKRVWLSVKAGRAEKVRIFKLSPSGPRVSVYY